MTLRPVLMFLLFGGVTLANPVSRPHIEVELIAAREAFVPGQPLEVAVRLSPEEGWHTYWLNPGDSGEPTKVSWKLPEGFEILPLGWPPPERIPMGPLTNFGYEGEVLLVSEIRGSEAFAPSVLPVQADVSWLVCEEEECIPGKAKLTLELPVAEEAGASRWSERFEETRASLPAPPEDRVADFFDRGRSLALHVTGEGDAPLDFFPQDEGLLDNSNKPEIRRLASGHELILKKARSSVRVEKLRGVLTMAGGRAIALEAQVGAQSGFASGEESVLGPAGDGAPISPGAAERGSQPESVGLAKIFLFAFLGGLILNLMPCVFPVLSIKVIGFVEKSSKAREKLLAHGMVYGVGILVSFWVLAGSLIALRAGGAELGWGFQLQSPLFLAILCFLFVAVGLNLLGAFEVGTRWMGVGQPLTRKSGYAGSFFTGVLATIVATPCTAPFMGTAIGFALAQPPGVSLLVFTWLGLGMAFPYVLFSVSPRLVGHLPKPGPWMETFKQLMAFPILGTVAWLVSVIGKGTDLHYVFVLLMGLVVFSMGLWAYGKAPRLLSWPTLLAVVFLAGGIALGTMDLTRHPQAAARRPEVWEPYTEQRLSQLLVQARPTFIDFTASWCITCQVNKRMVLDTEEILDKFAEKGVALLRADWTNEDAEISRKLEEFGRNGVPLYVLYSGSPGKAPHLLPQLLTKNIVIDALDEL